MLSWIAVLMSALLVVVIGGGYLYLKLIEDLFLDKERLNPATLSRPDSRPTVRERAAILGNLLQEFDFAQDPIPPLILDPRP